MRVADVITSPWAITPDMLREMRGIYETHLCGEKIDIAGVEARLGRSLNNEREGYEIVDGVAVIDVHGVIGKRMNIFTQISGGISSQILGQDIREAMADEKVTAIILAIDSPGGTVDGTFELADMLYSMRGEKPIIAFADGLMASAAYAIGAAADSIYISGDTATIGSIGVLATHQDYSGYEKQTGIITTEIYAGKFKRIASAYAPLTQEGREDIQSAVDYLYSIFVEKIAKFRGVPVSTVLDDMADGRLFIGQQAIDAGLADGVSTLDHLIAELSQGRMPDNNSSASGVVQLDHINQDKQEPEIMAIEEIKSTLVTKGLVAEQHPDIADAFRAEGVAQATEDGATAERERIQNVLSQSMPGHEALVEGLAFDGKTSGPEAAVKVLQAEKKAKLQVVDNLQADASEVSNIGASVDADEGVTEDKNLPLEDRCKAKWRKSASLRDEFGDDFGCYLAYSEASENGQIKMLGSAKSA